MGPCHVGWAPKHPNMITSQGHCSNLWGAHGHARQAPFEIILAINPIVEMIGTPLMTGILLPLGDAQSQPLQLPMRASYLAKIG